MTSPAADLRRPRLLVLASTYPRWVGDPEPGFVHELCRRLVDDFDVVVVCPSAPGALHRETMDGIDVQRFRYAPHRLEMLVNGGGITSNLRRNPWLYLLVLPFVLGMGIGVLAALRSHKPAVVHAHWLLPQGLIAALLLPRRLPLVVTSHGADLFAWRGRLFRAMKRFVLRRASTATVVSTPMVDEVVRLGMPPARVVVAPMGVDLCGRFTPDASVPRSAAEILFVGRLVEKKGLRHLIAAMPAIIEAIPDATLVVAGFGPEMAARVAQAPDTIDYAMTDITNADDDTSRQNRSPGSDRVRKDPQDNEMRQDRLLRHVRTDARTGQRTAALHLGCHAPR